MIRKPNISDLVAEKITIHTVRLLSLDADMRRRVLRILKQLERDIIVQMQREDPTLIVRPTFREQRLMQLIEQTRATMNSAYRAIRTEVDGDLRDLAEIEAEHAAASINAVAKTDIVTVAVSDVILREVARNTLIQGAPSRDWWRAQPRALERKFTQQMRMGLLAGETNNDLVRRVRGTQKNGYTDGIMEASRRDASALVRTSVQAVANTARMETYRANDDVINGTSWVSTLDGRTTEQCIALSGASWTLDGEPFSDSPFQGPDPGGPPIHWNCRSTRIARLKSLEELMGAVGPRKATRLEALPELTRASMDGQVAASLTFADWLKGKEADGPGFANGLLGKVRAELWRNGKLPLHRLIDQSARPLTIDGLRANVRGISAKAIEEARAA